MNLRSKLAGLLLFVAFSFGATTGLTAQITSLPPIAWPSTHPITFSFAPDLVPIGRYRNELALTLDARFSREDWQIEMLRALQTWSRHADLQFALVPDSPRAFGVPALSQGDPRFGDIRVGAFPQDQVLGNAVPYAPQAGSWAGDVLLDSTRPYALSTVEQDEFAYDLYSVMLHEVGNSLGLLDEELDFESVMFFAYVEPRRGLSWRDIIAIQSLYGPPAADPYEPPGGNDSFESATPSEPTVDFDVTMRMEIDGHLSSGDDVDVYRFEVPAGYENCWISLRASGRSLLVGRLTAYDGELSELVTQAAESPLRNDAYKEITSRDAGEIVHVVIDASEWPDFDFGDYRLVLDFGPDGGEPEEGDDEPEAERFFEAGDASLNDRLYDLAGPIDPEVVRETNRNRAIELRSPPGIDSGTRFELISTLAAIEDIDLYRFVTDDGADSVVSISLGPLGSAIPAFDLRLLDATGRALSTASMLRRSPEGDVSLVVSGIRPNSTYFVRIASATGNAATSNYLLTIDVPDRRSALATLDRIRLNRTTRDRFGSLVVRKTQLFRFDLSTESTDTTRQAVQMTITNANGRIEGTYSVRPGVPTTAYVWLPAGTHYVRFTARTRSGAAIAATTTTWRGAALSDDEGPILIDPSGNPISSPQSPSPTPPAPPTWQFPLTFVWLYELVVPPINPWR